MFARGGEQHRHLSQLADDVPHADGRRVALHDHQVVDAVGERRRVEHRIPAPILQRLLLEQPPVDDAVEDAAVHALVGRQAGGVERLKTCAVALQRGDLGADAGGGKVVEEVVVVVNAIAGGDRRMSAREVVEVAIDEEGEFA